MSSCLQGTSETEIFFFVCAGRIESTTRPFLKSKTSFVSTSLVHQMPKSPQKNLKNREEKRAQIIALKKNNFSDKEIAFQCGVHKSTVARVWKRTQITQRISDAKRSGRPSKLGPREKRYVVRMLNTKEGKTATQIQQNFFSKTGRKVSRMTVSRTLRQAGYVSRVKKKKPMLTPSHMKRRIRWANEFRNFKLEDWKYVVWSDETKFNLINSDGKEYYWTKNPGILTPDSIKATKKYGGGCLMIWGCMTWNGLGICKKIDGIMNADVYSKILREELMSSLAFYDLNPEHIIFQHDNDPKHTSRLAKETLEELKIEVMEWPAQSPDLNPIEHLWNHIEYNLRKPNKSYSTKDELWEDLEPLLNKKYTKFCQKLIRTMNQRVNDVKKANGFSTRW